MTKEQKQVIEFMNKAGQEVENSPTIVEHSVYLLRAKLILEEALECVEALGFKWTKGGNAMENFFAQATVIEPDMTLIADGLADLHYVAYCGTAAALGIDMEPVFQEVHRSNMSKFIDGYRREDGKWIKGPSYSPANLTPILKAQSTPSTIEQVALPPSS